MAIPKPKKKKNYRAKQAQKKIGQREAFEFADAADRSREEDKPDWMIARDEGKSSRGPAKPKPASRPVKENVIQTMFFRGPAATKTELEVGLWDKFEIEPVDLENNKRAATSLVAIYKGEEMDPFYNDESITISVWQIGRLTGFKAANDGLKAVENIGTVQASRYKIERALQGWSHRYGHTEVAFNMAPPMAGATIIQKPSRGGGHHHRM